MRIISGKFRGRTLKGPSGENVRPTGDRLRETLFDILGGEIRGAVLLDVFAGTGAVGLEAISRGAREVVFIERRSDGSRLIRQNIELCGVKTGYRILQQDAFTALRFLSHEGFKPDVAFLDPPYDWKPYRDLLEIIFKQGLARRDSRIIIEHHRKAALPPAGEGYHRIRLVRQGDHCLSFYTIADCGVQIADANIPDRPTAE